MGKKNWTENELNQLPPALRSMIKEKVSRKMKPVFKQTDSDLKEFLMSDKGFIQEDADRMIADGAYDLSNSEFKAWYAESGKGDVPAEPETPMRIYPKKKDPKKY